MKKILSILMALALTLSLAFTAFACTPNNPASDAESESVSESVSESESVYVPEPIVGAGENGEINLADALEILDPVLDNDYVTANITGTVKVLENKQNVYFEADVTANAYLKRTVKGYDVIAKIQVTIDKTPAEIRLYFVDGLGVIGQGYGTEFTYQAEELGSFNGLINMLNQEIANDPQATEIYMAAMPVLEEIQGMLGGEDAIGDVQFSMDFTQMVNDVIDFVVESQDESIHDLLLTLFGVDPTDEEAVAEVKGVIAEFYDDNPSVTVFIERIVNAINSAIKENARAQAEEKGEEFVEDEVFQIDLKEIVDAIQVESGMTTAEIVKMLNDELQGSGFVLPAPEYGETIYDCLIVYLEAVTLDAVVQAATQDKTATFTGIVDGLIEATKNITLKDAINFVGNLLIDLVESGATAPADESVEESVVETPENSAIDFVGILTEKNIKADAISVFFAYASDDLERPTALNLALTLGVSFDAIVYGEDGQTEPSTQTHTLTANVGLNATFDYAKPVIEFKIPTSVLEDLIVTE